MTHLTIGFWTGIAVIGATTLTAPAAEVATEVDGLEVFYGGFVGDFGEETTFDFGTTFTSVESATLHLTGTTDLHGSTLTFDVMIEGVISPTVEIITPTNSFDIEVPLNVNKDVLDGAGTIFLALGTYNSSGADLGTLVTEAVLIFDGTTCAADVTGDGAIDVEDLTAVILAWGECDDVECPEDIDGSGAVDVGDVVAVILGWGACG